MSNNANDPNAVMDADLGGCSSHEPYALQATDESMEPEFIKETVIVVEPSERCDSGNYIVCDYANDTWFRQYIESDGRRWLKALHPDFDDMEIKGPFKVRGIVISQAYKRQRKRYF